CRTGHAYTGDFRKTFIPNSQEPIYCPCDGETLETREHILRECNRYSQHRNILEEFSRSLILSEILGTAKGIQALHTFLQKSGAFTRTGQLRTQPNPPSYENEPE
ncbi:hypothetical protein B0H34DRAFT_629768, partial [Crassisporium funariophilum]